MLRFAGGVTLSAAVTSPVRSGMTDVQPVFVVRILLVAQLGIDGGSSSTTLIVNEQLGPALFAQVTVVAPTEKKEPDAGVQVTMPHCVPVVGTGCHRPDCRPGCSARAQSRCCGWWC